MKPQFTVNQFKKELLFLQSQYNLQCNYTFLLAQMVKCLPTTRETWVQSLGWEDPLEKGMATYSNVLLWRIPWKRSLSD